MPNRCSVKELTVLNKTCACTTNTYIKPALRVLTLSCSSSPRLYDRLVLVVVRVFDLLTTVGQVTEDTHAVLDTLIVVGVAVYGALDDCEERVDEAGAVA